MRHSDALTRSPTRPALRDVAPENEPPAGLPGAHRLLGSTRASPGWLARSRRAERFEAHGGLDAGNNVRLELSSTRELGRGGVPERIAAVPKRGDPRAAP